MTALTPQEIAESRREVGARVRFTQSLLNLAVMTNRYRGSAPEPAKPKSSEPGENKGSDQALY